METTTDLISEYWSHADEWAKAELLEQWGRMLLGKYHKYVPNYVYHGAVTLYHTDDIVVDTCAELIGYLASRACTVLSGGWGYLLSWIVRPAATWLGRYLTRWALDLFHMIREKLSQHIPEGCWKNIGLGLVIIVAVAAICFTLDPSGPTTPNTPAGSVFMKCVAKKELPVPQPVRQVASEKIANNFIPKLMEQITKSDAVPHKDIFDSIFRPSPELKIPTFENLMTRQEVSGGITNNIFSGMSTIVDFMFPLLLGFLSFATGARVPMTNIRAPMTIR